MMTARKLTYEELELKLFEAEDIIGALRNHEIDAIVGEGQVALVRLREAEEALARAREELEQRVVERTADLAKANHRLEEALREQEQVQRQLERHTEQLRDQAELLDLAHDMIFVHDMDGRIVLWNCGAEAAYGWKKDEALGQLSHKLLQTEYSAPLLRITTEIIRTGRWEGELVHTTRDSRKVPVATRWALRRDPVGRPVAILEIDTDITGRKQAEREMAAARHFAESIVDTIQESLVVLDPQLQVISANRSFHETFGTGPEQVEGRLFYTLWGGMWDLPQLRRRLQEVLPRNAGFQDFELDCGGEELKAFLLSARPVLGQAPGAESILLVIQDVTLRQRQQREIAADKQQLASLTEELMMIEERQRRQIATALHDSVGQSLIFAKRELGELLRQASPEAEDVLQQVQAQIVAAIKQTRDLTFDLSPATLYTFGLQAALEELAEQFSESEGFACRVDGPEEPAPLGEQVQSMLYRSVRELLVNVAKHARAKCVGIQMMQDGQTISVAVQDDGRGFDPATLDGQGRERGFGLFSIRERLTRVGGGFTIQSAEGRGTKIVLMAPLELGPCADWGF